MRPKTPERIEAESLCKRFKDTPTQTLARRLTESHKMTLKQARNLVADIRGNGGNRRRAYAVEPRPNGVAGAKMKMPPSLAEAWLPFELGSDIKVAVLSDIHIPYHSTVALNAAVKYCKRRRPDVLLLNGDLADFYSISRYQNDPSKRDFKGEVESVKQCLGWLRQQFPKARIVLKAGNHEERWQHWLWNKAPEISDFDRMRLDEWIDAPKYGVEVVTDQRPIMAGRLPIMHGHELGKGGVAAPVNPARGLFMRTISTMMIGHLHRTSHHAEPNWQHEEMSCWSTGCLCDMNPEYARINKWNYGFAYVPVDQSGNYHVDNLRLGLAGEVW